ncbi:MAG: winged helix-turn-helix domain-containing protein [Saccharolobus sp.]|uniref:winged helix-turn-helix domain-containing protein n=1 Tax=Saccharolobus TaxID=2100760 RepID=UPI001F0E2C3F|nr:winged helix-turn-helix domain-containing protein [Saccharolobus shibatae]MCH4816777.1 winged helix-turn-helix domain-containing protein [Saccharolobus shibatae]
MALKFNKRKRNQFDIIYDILCAVSNGPVLKTRLIYKANVNYLVAEKYISYMEESGLIKKDDRFYYITAKGREIHKLLDEYKKRAEELKRILETLNKEMP